MGWVVPDIWLLALGSGQKADIPTRPPAGGTRTAGSSSKSGRAKPTAAALAGFKRFTSWGIRAECDMQLTRLKTRGV